MYLEIKKSELVPDKFGNHIKITMVGLYTDEGKWIKWVKLNDYLLNQISSARINVSINIDK